MKFFAKTAIGIVAIAAAGTILQTRVMRLKRSAELSPLSSAERDTRDRIRMHVQKLAGDIGGRSATQYEGLRSAANYIEAELRSYGYNPQRQGFSAGRLGFENLEAELSGTEGANSIAVIGAHYDTAGGLPGANDNASGVAACLELARIFKNQALPRTIRWVFFTNEEPPYFQTPSMGSYVYAKRCRERGENIAGMLSLETIGYYSDEPSSQSYPIGIHTGYPDRGNFLGFVADFKSALLLRSALKSFRSATSLPAEGVAAPASIPGLGWSDHWAFWQFGYKALMLTDTAPFRYPHYHTKDDTPEKLDYERLARAFTGISKVVTDLASK